MENGNARWLIDKDLELYGAYLDITLKATAFVLAISGGIVSYFLLNRDKDEWIWLSLLLPFMINCGFFFLSWHSIRVASEIKTRHRKNWAAAELDGKAYDLGPLGSMLKISSMILVLTNIGILLLILEAPW
jgi:hypothetical protein